MGDCKTNPEHEVELPVNICNVYFPISGYCCKHPEGHNRAIERAVKEEYNRAMGHAANDTDVSGN